MTALRFQGATCEANRLQNESHHHRPTSAPGPDSEAVNRWRSLEQNLQKATIHQDIQLDPACAGGTCIMSRRYLPEADLYRMTGLEGWPAGYSQSLWQITGPWNCPCFRCVCQILKAWNKICSFLAIVVCLFFRGQLLIIHNCVIYVFFQTSPVMFWPPGPLVVQQLGQKNVPFRCFQGFCHRCCPTWPTTSAWRPASASRKTCPCASGGQALRVWKKGWNRWVFRKSEIATDFFLTLYRYVSFIRSWWSWIVWLWKPWVNSLFQITSCSHGCQASWITHGCSLRTSFVKLKPCASRHAWTLVGQNGVFKMEAEATDKTNSELKMS